MLCCALHTNTEECTCCAYRNDRDISTAAELVQALAAEVVRCREASDAATVRATGAEAAASEASGRLRDADDLARRHAALQACTTSRLRSRFANMLLAAPTQWFAAASACFDTGAVNGCVHSGCRTQDTSAVMSP